MPFMAHNCIVVNLDRCIGCYSCELACKMENDVALGERWNKVVQIEPFGEFPDVKTYWLPVMCQQCEEAPCVHVCPTGASYRDEETNIVLIDKSKCIGCKYCMMACPYGVRSWNKENQVVEKCTLCNQLTSAGELPACVKVCCGKARFYGDLDDPESDASKALAEADPSSIHHLPDVGNNPATAYILSERIGEWRVDDLKQTTSKYMTTTGSVD
jgi:Fe-S-cluster-containing dehydrogenase component